MRHKLTHVDTFTQYLNLCTRLKLNYPAVNHEFDILDDAISYTCNAFDSKNVLKERVVYLDTQLGD